jgi:hypothetical protein
MTEPNDAVADVPIRFRLANGRVVHVTLDSDRDEVTVQLFGPRCGDLLVIPSAGNSIRLRASGRGVSADE